MPSLCRENANIDELMSEIENAIVARKALNANLERLSEEARIHHRKAKRFHETKNYQRALYEYSQSLCSFPYKFHNAFRCHSDISLSENDGIVINFEKKIRGAQHSLNCDYQQQIAESLADRAEILRYLGHHKLAIEDIEEALSHSPSKEIHSKISNTHKLCLSEMRRQTRNHNPCRSPNVAHGQHRSIANASDLIKVNYATEKGRYLEANGSIKAGDVLIVEKPYASILLPDYRHSHCYHCMKLLVAPIPCFSCQDVLFCSKVCQSKAYSLYHSIECKIWPLIQVIEPSAHLSIRILLTAKPEELLGVLEIERNPDREKSSIHGITNIKYQNDYKAVYNLVTNSELQSKTSVSSNTLVSAIISQFLLGPEAATSCVLNDKQSSSESKMDCIRLSSSSPAMLGIMHQSNGNLNSLADAFAQHVKGESIHENRKGISRSSFDVNQSDQLRINSPLIIGKDSSFMQNRRRAKSGCEESPISGFFQTVLNERQIQKLILRHMQQVCCNMHTVTTLTWVEAESERAKEEIIFGNEEVTFQKEQRQIALALYPTSCLLNHACDPDVIVSFNDDELVVRATHNISEGSEITHCYVPHVSRMQRAARQRMLQNRYFFTCSCVACRRDEERERQQLCSLTFLCPECKDDAKVDCTRESCVVICTNRDCGKTNNAELLLNEIQYTRELFMDAVDAFKVGNVKKSLTTLQKVMKRRSSILNSKDKLVAEVHDALSRCYEVLHEWEFASYHCSMNLDSLEKQHGKTSSECALAVAKLAKFLYNGKLFEKADKVIERGIKLLSLHYGEKYYGLEELMKIKEYVQNFPNPVGQLSL